MTVVAPSARMSTAGAEVTPSDCTKLQELHNVLGKPYVKNKTVYDVTIMQSLREAGRGGWDEYAQSTQCPKDEVRVAQLSDT